MEDGSVDSRVEQSQTLLTYVVTIARIVFVTASYWLVGILPEENHAKKGDAWARIHAFRWAAWHFRKYLKHSDDSFGHASLAWCYAQLGMLESAREHYRIAYVRRRRPDIGCALAHLELTTGNVAAARSLHTEIAPQRHQLSPEFVPLFVDLESQLSDASIERPHRETSLVSNDVARSAFDGARGETPTRLLLALKSAYATFATSFFVVNACVLLSVPDTTPVYWFGLCWFSLIVALMFCVGLLAVHAPVLALLRMGFGSGLNSLHSGVLSVALVPAPLGIFFLVLPGQNPTSMWSQFALWAGENPVELVPFVLGSAVFGSAFVRNRGLISDSPSNSPPQPTDGRTKLTNSM
jgi:hypothetical protein